MNAAEKAIGQAQADAGQARERFNSASTRVAMETAAGSGGALAEQEQARGEIFAAEEREAAARKALDRATEDFELAQKRGTRAEERARDAARAASGALGATGGAAPVLAMPGASAGPAGPVGGPAGGPGSPFGSFWGGVGYDSMVGGFQGYAYYRGHTHVSGYTTRRGTAVAPYMRRAPSFARWAKYSRIEGRTTVVFSGLGGAAQQLEADADEDLTGAQRVTRTTGAAANDAALSWGGAASGAWAGSRAGAVGGAAIGSVFPIVGTTVGGAVGTVGGALVGGIVGSGVGSLVADHTREFVADTSQAIGDGVDSAWDSTANEREAIANEAEDAWDATAGARETVSEGFDKITPW